jgi:hypothetical protein
MHIETYSFLNFSIHHRHLSHPGQSHRAVRYGQVREEVCEPLQLPPHPGVLDDHRRGR